MTVTTAYRGPLAAPTAARPRVPLPPDRLPLVRDRRLRKGWRYVGYFGEELSLCLALAYVGPLRQAFWAVWDRREGRLHERTYRHAAGVRMTPGHAALSTREVGFDLRFAEQDGAPMETVTPYGGAYAWTVKRGAIALRGTVRVGGREHRIDGPGIIDDSGGYPPRHTVWNWAAGVGEDVRGRAVAWNLATGIHDDAGASEQTVWIDGVPRHVGPVRFAVDLSAVDDALGQRDGQAPVPDEERGVALRFHREAVREHRENLIVMRQSYEQPFGTVTGTLPGGVELRSAFGVMEHHDVVW
ncbi:DUF2804 family protein [Patulibacter defluvii]|uniref:DUF2804 family protein n=1 Tax=Patulibacter defluvii TaxID=3095358 RepID=UPI002A759079|nr:DUF2804 family protein [Patulibacter sp. DM4]